MCVGDHVRIWVVSAGLTLFAEPSLRLQAGAGRVFELVCDVAGNFPFVNHGFGRGQKGAIGILVVES